MNIENTDENILRYLKFIVISGDARTQKNRDGVSQKESRIFAIAQLGHYFLLYKSYHFLSRALALNKYLPICLFKFYS